MVNTKYLIWAWSVMIPINLTSNVSDVFDTKFKTSLPDLWLENNDWKSVYPSQRNDTQTDPGWSGRWWRSSSSDWSSKRLIMRSKENEELLTLIRSIDHHFSYYTLALAIELIQIFTILLWSQIIVLLSIRLTGSQQIDFKVFQAFAVEIFLES